MERRLKERLVGAGILVILIVLVVPELLSGPKQAVKPGAVPPAEPTRTVTVDLDTQRTMAFETPPEAPATANLPPPPAAFVSLPQPPTVLPEAAGQPAQAASARTVPPPQSAGAAALENQTASPKSWALQLGSFASRENAEQLVRTVKGHNSPAYISTSGAGKSLRYRVRVGPLTDRAAAEHMRVKLKSEGHPASVVAP